jgi:hypothetical protein
VVLPDQTGMGAVPLGRANAARERNRSTLAVSPMILPGAECSASGQGEQRRRQRRDKCREALLARIDAHGEPADVGDDLVGDLGDDSFVVGEHGVDLLARFELGEGTWRELELRVEVVEVPQQAVLGPGAFGDQVSHGDRRVGAARARRPRSVVRSVLCVLV